MNYVLAVFSVRTDTMQFYNLLSRAGINAVVVETPKALSVSCGISVKFSKSDFVKARNILTKAKIGSFVRFYAILGFLGQKTYSPIR